MDHLYPWGAGTPLERPLNIAIQGSRNFSAKGSFSISVSIVFQLGLLPCSITYKTTAVCSCHSGLKATTPSHQSKIGDREASCQFKGLEGDKCHSPNQLRPSTEYAKPL